MSEGIPAFQENDPASILFGTEWQPFYDIDSEDALSITTTIHPYDFALIANDTRLYFAPNTTQTICLTLHNTGGSNDSYCFSVLSDNKINASLSQTNVNLPSYATCSLPLNVTVGDKGKYTSKVTVKSNNTQTSKSIIFTIFVSLYGVDIAPDNTEILRVGSDALILSTPITLTNTGCLNDTYLFTIEAPASFRPSIEGENATWNYTGSSAGIVLAGGEQKNVSLIPRMVQSKPGIYTLNLSIQSLSKNSIYDDAKIQFHYKEDSYFTIDTTHRNIAPDKKAQYVITLENLSGEQLSIKLNEVDSEWTVTIFHDAEAVLTNEGSAILDVENENSNILLLEVTPLKDTFGLSSTLQLSIILGGNIPKFGILPFIIGTILTTCIAVLIAAPLGLSCAIFLAEFCPKKLRNILRPLYELLAGIPSVLYGLWGYLTFGPWISTAIYPIITSTIGQVLPLFSETSKIGSDVLTASIVLSIMIIPIVITLSEDSIRSVQQSLKEGSLALGATRWQTMRRIILPTAKSGIVSSVILGTGRAIGETMAVLMIMRYATAIPSSLFDSAGTMTSVIAAILGSTFNSDLTRHALFAVGMILFFMIFTLNIVIYRITQDRKQRKAPQKKLHKVLPTLLLIISSYSSKKFKIVNVNEKVKENTISNTKKKLFKVIDTLTVASTRKKQFKILSNFRSDHKHETKQTRFFDALDIEHLTKKARQHQRLINVLLILASLLVTFFLFLILSDIVIKGAPAIQFEYIFNREVGVGVEGGFANAIVGSLQLIALAISIAAPLSIGSAIYVQEYARKNNFLTKIILFTSDTLASTPSIVFGAFGFIFFVWYLGFGFSVLAGGITLAFMIIPLMLRSSVEAIKSVGGEIREGSLALGATKWQTIVRVVVPPALPTIVSGIIISIGRAIGETAAILFTAGYAIHFSTSFLQPAASLPNLIFKNYDLSGRYPILGEKVYAAALILIIIVLILNSLAKLAYIRSAKMDK